MKIETKNGVLTATAESVTDMLTLIALGGNKVLGGKKVKHERAQYTRTCKHCGRKCVGLGGLRIHESIVHGLKKPAYEKKTPKHAIVHDLRAEVAAENEARENTGY